MRNVVVKKSTKKRKSRKRLTTKIVANSGKTTKGQFTKGHEKIGGREKGTKNHDGLQVVLNMLKDFIADKKNLDKLKADFQKKFNSNPSGFYYKMVMPLYPKSVDVGTSDTFVAYVTTMQEIFSKAEHGVKKKKR